MKTVSVYFAVIGNLLMLASCNNRQYTFVQPSTPIHYYSTPDVTTPPAASVETVTQTTPELMASVGNELPQVATTAAQATAASQTEVPVTTTVQVGVPTATRLHPVLSRHEARQQLQTYAKEVRGSRRPADGSGSTNGLAVAALICGIVSLLVLPILFGPLAVIFGAIGMSQTKQRNERGYGLAVAGLVMGIIATVIVFIILAR